MKQNRLKKITIAVMLAALTAALAGCGSSTATNTSDTANPAEASDTAGSENTDSAQQSGSDETETEDKGIAFPYILDEGKLSVNSVFTSDIANPDADNAEGENIVTLEVENISDTTLVSGDFTAILSDGTSVPFHIDYLPGGEKAWLFAADNAMIEDPVADEITAETQYTDRTPGDCMMGDTFTVAAEESTISLANISDEAQNNITVYYHNLLTDTIYGGMVYAYTVDSLAAGETITFQVEDCLLGKVEPSAITLQ